MNSVPPVQEVEDILPEFAGVRAVDCCSFDARPRTITGLIGPNGAGMTRLKEVQELLSRNHGGELQLSPTDAAGGRVRPGQTSSGLISAVLPAKQKPRLHF